MMRRSLRFLVNFGAIAMPALSPSMETGTIVEWKKKVGDFVKEGELFCTVQTDKAVVDYTNSFDEGYLAKIFVNNGEACEVGKTVAVLVDDKADLGKVNEFVPEGGAPAEAAAAPAPQATSAPAASAPSSSPAGTAEPPADVSVESIAMPALSPSMETGTIVEWKKKVGDFVKEGELFCTVQTDKAVVDYTNSFDEGYLAKIFVNNGEACEVGKTVALLVSKAEDIPKLASYHPADAPGAGAVPSPAASTASAPAPAAPKAHGSSARYGDSLEAAIKASGPSVGRIAAGLPQSTLESISASGKGGRFLKSDFVGQPGFDYSDPTPAGAIKKSSPPASAKPAAAATAPSSGASQEGIYDVELQAGHVVKVMDDTSLLHRLISTMELPAPKPQKKAQA